MTSTFAVASPTNLCDNGYTTDFTNYRQSSPFARWQFVTSARRMMLKSWNNIYAAFPQWTHIAVMINKAHYATLEASAANAQQFSIDLPAGRKTIDLVAGPQSNPGSTVLGSYLKSVYFSGAGDSVQVAPTAPANRVVVYGDSIAVGTNATFPTHQGWAPLLRAEVPVAMEAWGYRSLHEDASTSGLRDALVAQLASFAPGSVWLAIGTNDYGLNKWAAADFGTAYAALLDDLNTALPGVTIYCQTPITRTTETANGSGSTLGDYRTQIANAVSSRTSFATLVDGTAWTIELDDGIHPTTAGHAVYAAAVATALGL